MKTIEQRMAEALVECGHASIYEIDQREHLQHNPPIALIIHDQDGKVSRVTCDPFADTLEGRKQADALMTHFRKINLLIEYYISGESEPMDEFEERKEAITWCLEQLTGEKDDE